MRGRQRRAHHPLVAQGHIQHCTPPRHVQPLVAVAHKEIGVDGGEVDVDHPHALRAVDEGEEACLAAGGGQRFEGEAHARQGGDDVEEHEAGAAAGGEGFGEGGAEGGEDGGVRAGVEEGDGARGEEGGVRFEEVVDCFVAAGVDGGEVEDFVAAVGVPDYVAEDGVDAGCGVGDEDGCFRRDVEELRDGGAGAVQEFGVFVADEGVRGRFGAVLVGPELGLDCAGDGAEGAWGVLVAGCRDHAS